MNFDPQEIRRDFPILKQMVNGKPLVYFDNAATTQKPQVMVDEIVRYYSEYNANIHRGVHSLSQRATAAYEATREYIAQLYNCKPTEVILTKGDTESLNIIAYSLGELVLGPGDSVVLTDSEHHSNIVPWQLIAKRKTVKGLNPVVIKYAHFNEDGTINHEDLLQQIDTTTKIVSFTLASNTFGVINNAKALIATIRKANPKVYIIIDAAQYVGHQKFDFMSLGADFITFSAHKLCGPTGVGVLIGKEAILQAMQPVFGGGDMIKEVDWKETTYNDLPYKFEAGTPNIADVIAFKYSLEYLDDIGFENILTYEKQLASYLLQQLSNLKFIDVYGPKTVTPDIDKIALVSFNVHGIHAHDIGSILDEDGIAVRSGHHCTQLIMKRLQIPASVRASLYIYNTFEEIDIFIASLKRAYTVFN